ncbi:MAG: lipopolysaccharide biosynthesis protein [Salinivirgaceae bacterium]|nr:lipopolysaccharide biosynthesis protein [Salinivirgaceae bacterium]
MSIAENCDLEIEINRVANNESLSTSAFLKYFCGMNSLESKVVTATKWSALTEIASKLVSPISTMILARLLTPEAYGAVATTTIIISFAELFTDAGFQKYIIQHDFTDDDDRDKSINVAFWSNLVMSLIIWGIIIAFRYPIARIVGSPGLETAIAVACAAIPIAAFSSIQSAIYKRNLNFRVPFIVRMIGIGITFFITIPLAFWLRNYWALIISNLIHYAVGSLVFSLYSDWKPKLYYSFRRLRKMLGFSIWIIIDQFLSWTNNYLDIFIAGKKFSQHTLGIYKTSINTSNKMLGIFSKSFTPILLPTYSKLQNDIPQLRTTMLKMQKYFSIILLPVGFIIFLYSDLITRIFLGNQWTEAAPLIGIWGLIQCFSLTINRFCSNVYVAINKPHISVILSSLFAIVTIPTILFSSQYGFQTMFVARTLTKLWLLSLHLITIFLLIRLSPFKVISNILPELMGCGVMVVITYSLSALCDTIALQIASMMTCLSVYFGLLFAIRNERLIIKNLWEQIANKVL